MELFLGCEQRIKITTWSKIEYSVPQESILVTLLFNINVLDTFFEQKDFKVATCSDDNGSYVCDKNLQVLLITLQIYALKLFELFSNSYIKINSDNSNLVFSSNRENKKVELNGEVINNTQVQKLLGVHINYQLKFDAHIETLCKKVRKMLHTLVLFIKDISKNQAQMLMRHFIMLQFRYSLLIWMCHSRKINSEANKGFETCL